MQRTVELRVKIPEIVLARWFPGEQDALSFPLDQIEGTITLNLDPESVKVLDYAVDNGGKQYPISYGCNSVFVRAEQYLAYGDPRMAIVEAQTAFEVFVHRLVKEYYQKKGKTQPNLEECGFKNVLCDHLSKRVRRFEKGVTQYDEWEAKAYRSRCDIVHRGGNVSREAASEAISSVKAAMVYLHGD